MKIVGDLGTYSRPVDGVYGCEFVGFVDFGVREEGFDYVLAIVKGAFDTDVVHVLVENGSHLCFLHWRYFALRVEHDDGDILLPSETVDGCRT